MIEVLKSEEIVRKVGGKFKLTALIQKRLIEIMQGARPLVEREVGMTDMELVIQEILEDKISIDYEGSGIAPPPGRFDWLLCPEKLWSPKKDLCKEVPDESGAYGWYFDEIPGVTPTSRCVCIRRGEKKWTLLYVGIAGKSEGSKNTLRRRICNQHIGGNREASTLRKSLGYLLKERLGIVLRRRKTGTYWFDKEDELRLKKWIIEHARVAWKEDDNPKGIEDAAIRSLSLPLNIKGNDDHPFFPVFKKIRDQAKKNAIDA